MHKRNLISFFNCYNYSILFGFFKQMHVLENPVIMVEPVLWSRVPKAIVVVVFWDMTQLRTAELVSCRVKHFVKLYQLINKCCVSSLSGASNVILSCFMKAKQRNVQYS